MSKLLANNLYKVARKQTKEKLAIMREAMKEMIFDENELSKLKRTKHSTEDDPVERSKNEKRRYRI
ncbi:MAG: hypothetical protein ACTSPI_17030 [Candidatus Heimdallarchaeaceae archaeon]